MIRFIETQPLSSFHTSRAQHFAPLVYQSLDLLNFWTCCSSLPFTFKPGIWREDRMRVSIGWWNLLVVYWSYWLGINYDCTSAQPWVLVIQYAELTPLLSLWLVHHSRRPQYVHRKKGITLGLFPPPSPPNPILPSPASLPLCRLPEVCKKRVLYL